MSYLSHYMTPKNSPKRCRLCFRSREGVVTVCNVKEVLLFREIVLIKEEIEEGSPEQLLCDPDMELDWRAMERWKRMRRDTWKKWFNVRLDLALPVGLGPGGPP